MLSRVNRGINDTLARENRLAFFSFTDMTFVIEFVFNFSLLRGVRSNMNPLIVTE